jgi:TonB-dependent Receptor Plug Domain
MLRTLFLSVLFICIVSAALAQRGIYLVDSLTKVPVQAATVFTDDWSFSTLTDENGYASLSGLTGTTAMVNIACVGFQNRKISLADLANAGGKATIYLVRTITSLSEVTVKASGTGGIFKTISDLDIHLRPINNSQEVLRIVPGLFIGQHAGGGKAEQIFLRGFDLDHGTDINISVDGMPVNMVSHAHGQGYADLHFVIPELINRVNFDKGPYFGQKGNFTTAGFVEFRTKDYLENNYVKVEAGQFNTYRATTAVNLLKPDAQRRNHSLFIAGEGMFTQGFFDSPQDFTRFNGMLKYHGRISEKNTVTASLTGFTSKWLASGQVPVRAIESGEIGWFGAIDDTEGGQTSRYNANLELLTRLNNGAVLRNQLFYTRNLFELYSNFTFFREDPVNGDQIRQKEDRNIFGYNSLYLREYSIGKLRTETRAGIQVRYDDVDDLELTRTRDRKVNTNEIMQGQVNELNVGAFYIQKLSVTNRLDITGALRVDYFSNRYVDQLASSTSSVNATIFSPKLNFNYRLNDKVQVYLYNGRGFHSNDTRVAVQKGGRDVLPAAYGSDLGGIFRIGDHLMLQTAVWYLWLDQEFVYVGDEGVVEAGGQTRRYGWDFSARYEVTRNLYADFDFNLTNPRALNVPKEESYLALAPVATSVGGLTYRKQYGWNGSLRYRYMADRPANEFNSVIAEGYFVLDGIVNYTRPRWELSLAIQNMLNSRWKETQFDTESRLFNEPAPVSEIHFTPGTPFFTRLGLTVNF